MYWAMTLGGCERGSDYPRRAGASATAPARNILVRAERKGRGVGSDMRALPWVVLALLTGCARTPPALETPVILVGVVSHPRWTGWQRDFCQWAQPVLEPVATENCLSAGGELYEAWLQDPRT